MGFLGKIEEGYQNFRQGQLDRRKKNLGYLKQKAAIAAQEQQYNAVINKSKADKMNSFNARMDAFAGAMTGNQGRPANKGPASSYSAQNSMDALMGVAMGKSQKPNMMQRPKRKASRQQPRVIILR